MWESHPLMIASGALPGMQCVINVLNVDTFSQSVDPLQRWEKYTLTVLRWVRHFLGTLTKQGDNPNSSPWAVTVSLNGKLTQFDIDTEAKVSVISQKAYRKITSPKLYCPQRI